MDFSFDFVEKMKARMATSFHKYGSWAKNRPHVDCIENVKVRMKIYEDSGNLEGLVDAANFLMMEFMIPKHTKAHFRSMNSEESPGIKCFPEKMEKPDVNTCSNCDHKKTSTTSRKCLDHRDGLCHCPRNHKKTGKK